jgi:hypothetical protein
MAASVRRAVRQMALAMAALTMRFLAAWDNHQIRQMHHHHEGDEDE